MSPFAFYLGLGFEHLLDFQGADHILFVVVLCAAYSLKAWRELLILITAFTVGHSLSLALATLGAVKVDTGWVEFLIPVTIAAAAVVNVFTGPVTTAAVDRTEEAGGPVRSANRVRLGKYGLALVFGLIHGLGFSNFLRLLLGDEGELFIPLLAFNIGLELAQIVVALSVLVLGYAGSRWTGVTSRMWNLCVSLVIGVLAVGMAAGRLP